MRKKMLVTNLLSRNSESGGRMFLDECHQDYTPKP